MDYTLVYPSRREAGGAERRFDKICPYTSGTVAKQRTEIKPRGLTLIGFLPPDGVPPFRKAIECIQKAGHNFHDFKRLHFTVLGLFAGERPLGSDDIRLILEATHEYFSAKAPEPMTIEFDMVRPGIFAGQPDYSDGTVVAMVKEDAEAQILEWANELSVYLGVRCVSILGKRRRRPLPGVWCSLGFFDEATDFAVNQEVFRAFVELKKFDAKVAVERLSLVTFAFKSLEDADEVGGVTFSA